MTAISLRRTDAKISGGGGSSRLILALVALIAAFLVFLIPSSASASTLPDIFDPDEIAFTEVFANSISVHALALDQEGRLWAWGQNNNGQLGLGDSTNRNIPTLVPLAGLSGVTSFDTIIAGGSHTLAFDQQGRLWAWGANANGQLGLVDTADRDRPTLVPLSGLSGVTSFDTIVAGGSHTLALDQDGRLWAWGSNIAGQLGLGDTANRSCPTLVPLAGLSEVTSFDTIMAGANHTFAFDQDDRLWVWGWNAYGQLGLGDATYRVTPVIMPLAGLAAGGIPVDSFDTIITGGNHTFAFDQQGRLWAWGANANGQLGLGDITSRNRPTHLTLSGLVAGDIPVTSFEAIIGGGAHTFALDQQGRLWAWGQNTHGQLGLGDNINRDTPTFVPLAGLSGVIPLMSVVAGNQHTVALDRGGRLWTWGPNHVGQLGDGTATGRNRPVRITNLIYPLPTIPLTKQLTAAESVDLSDDITFTFNLVPTVYEIDGINSVAHSHAISTQITLNDDSDRQVVAGVATTTSSINLWQILSNIDFGSTTGVFVWNLEEEAGSSGIVGMNYDDARFQVRAWVDSTGQVVHVLVYNLTTIEGEDVSGSKMYPIFENELDAEGDLEISKVVEGEFANLATLFNFTLTLTDGPLTSIPTTLPGQIYNADNLPVSPPGGIVEISAGANTFTLQHGQRIVIQGLPAGTIFSVTEAATMQFQPQAVTTIPDVGAYTVTANQGESLATASHAIVSGDVSTTVVFTNFYGWVPPTGLTIAGISMIPFIVVALLLAATLASRRRRAIETLPLA